MNLFDTLKEKLRRKPAQPIPEGLPFFLMVGSMRDCSAKDALAFARGLAEKYVTSPQLGLVSVYHDRFNGRYVYEIHEGGPGHSIVEKLLQSVQQTGMVRIQLASGGYLAVEDVAGELISLLYPAGEEPAMVGFGANGEDQAEAPLQPIQQFCSDTVKLPPLFPEHKALPRIASIVLGVAGALFLLTGTLYAVNISGLLAPDILLTQAQRGNLPDWQDNPVWQMDKARADAEAQGKSVLALKKEGGKWTWELSR